MLKGALSAGLINGLGAGLAIHWFSMKILYIESPIFEWPGSVTIPINSIALFALVLSLLSVGPYAILRSKGRVETRWEGLIAGSVAGVVLGIVIYLVVGALASTMALGLLPLSACLAVTSQIPQSIDDPQEFAKRLYYEAIVGTYLIIVGHLFFGGLIGGLEGLLFTHVRNRKRRQRNEKLEKLQKEEGNTSPF